MSTQQDIYAADSENRPPMLNKENFVSWSSRLLRYAKSRPNGKLIYNSIMNGPYARRIIPKPGSDIRIQEKKAELFNEWERFTSTDGESIESYYHHFLKLMNDFKRNKDFPKKNQVVKNPGVRNVRNQIGLIVVSGIANQNPNENELGHLARNCIVRPRRRNDAYLQTQLLIAQKEEAGIQLQAKEFDLMQASTSGTQTDKAPVYDSDGSAEYTELLEPIPKPHQVQNNDSNVISEVFSVEQDVGTVDQHPGTIEETCAYFESLYTNLEIKVEKVNSVSEQKDTTKGTSVNTQFYKQSILGKPPYSSGSKLYVVTPFPKSKGLSNIDKTHALSKPVTSNSVPTPQESKVMNTDKVITPGMFRINPYREEKYVPNKVRASIRTNPITVSQPHVITKKDVNSDSNGLFSTRVDNTAKTRRPKPRSNTKNDRVPSASKSSSSKNKEVKVEEHPRNLMLSKNKKPYPCLIIANHDVYVLNYVNGMNSRGKKQKANVSNTENKNKQKPKVMKPKKVGSNKRLASPKPSKPRSYLRWSPTGIPFDLKGKIIASSEYESQSDCFNGCSKHMTGNLKLLINFIWKFLGTLRFGNDHVAAILGFGDLQWGNILIIKVYFVEGLGHNLFSVGQFCDSDLKVAFIRNTCFVRNLEGVDLLKGNHTTNLYTINLHEMAYASPICLMARATSTKSWLWHQCLPHLNFDTINDLAENNLVTGLSKFKYHKEHLCPSCEQTKRKRASHPPKPVPNSKKRTPQQNRVVERRNQMLVEAARIMLIFSRAQLFLWAEAIDACYTQNRSIIHRQFNITPYELINGRKLDISFLHVFGALCYPTNDHEDIGKLGAKGDIGFFISYSADSCAYRVYNQRTKKIMETMNATFDKLSAMAFEQSSLKPELQSMTSGQINLGIDLTYASSTITTQQLYEGELDLLFKAMYDDHIGGQSLAAPRT
nr:reverse transcriptase domain-containing protein [Tanacetum cinerariifolium]